MKTSQTITIKACINMLDKIMYNFYYTDYLMHQQGIIYKIKDYQKRTEKRLTYFFKTIKKVIKRSKYEEIIKELNAVIEKFREELERGNTILQQNPEPRPRVNTAEETTLSLISVKKYAICEELKEDYGYVVREKPIRKNITRKTPKWIKKNKKKTRKDINKKDKKNSAEEENTDTGDNKKENVIELRNNLFEFEQLIDSLQIFEFPLNNAIAQNVFSKYMTQIRKNLWKLDSINLEKNKKELKKEMYAANIRLYIGKKKLTYLDEIKRAHYLEIMVDSIFIKKKRNFYSKILCLLTYFLIFAENKEDDIIIKIYNLTQVVIHVIAFKSSIYHCFINDKEEKDKEIDLVFGKMSLIREFEKCIANIKYPMGIKYPGTVFNIEVDENALVVLFTQELVQIEKEIEINKEDETKTKKEEKLKDTAVRLEKKCYEMLKKMVTKEIKLEISYNKEYLDEFVETIKTLMNNFDKKTYKKNKNLPKKLKQNKALVKKDKKINIFPNETYNIKDIEKNIIEFKKYIRNFFIVEDNIIKITRCNDYFNGRINIKYNLENVEDILNNFIIEEKSELFEFLKKEQQKTKILVEKTTNNNKLEHFYLKTELNHYNCLLEIWNKNKETNWDNQEKIVLDVEHINHFLSIVNDNHKTFEYFKENLKYAQLFLQMDCRNKIEKGIGEFNKTLLMNGFQRNLEFIKLCLKDICREKNYKEEAKHIVKQSLNLLEKKIKQKDKQIEEVLNNLEQKIYLDCISILDEKKENFSSTEYVEFFYKEAVEINETNYNKNIENKKNTTLEDVKRNLKNFGELLQTLFFHKQNITRIDTIDFSCLRIDFDRNTKELNFIVNNLNKNQDKPSLIFLKTEIEKVNAMLIKASKTNSNMELQLEIEKNHYERIKEGIEKKIVLDKNEIFIEYYTRYYFSFYNWQIQKNLNDFTTIIVKFWNIQNIETEEGVSSLNEIKRELVTNLKKLLENINTVEIGWENSILKFMIYIVKKVLKETEEQKEKDCKTMEQNPNIKSQNSILFDFLLEHHRNIITEIEKKEKAYPNDVEINVNYINKFINEVITKKIK